MRQSGLEGKAITPICMIISLAAILPMMAVAAPTITIDTDKSTYVAGETLDVSLEAHNHDFGVNVDAYVGLILPDKSILVYGQCGWTDSIEPWVTDVHIPSTFDFGPMTILTLEVPAGVLGDFQFAAGLTNASTPEFIGEISFAPFRIESAHPAPTAYIDLIWPSPATQGEDTIQFAGHGEDRDGWIEAHEWSSDLDGVLSTEEDFSLEATDLEAGKHTISYRVQDNDGQWSESDTESLVIETLNTRPEAYIDAIYPNPATQGEDTVEFMGHGIDTDGTVEGYEWSSDVDGVLSTDEDFSIEAADLTVGTHTISYRVQDDDGAWSAPVTDTLVIEAHNILPTAHIDSITPNPAAQGEDTVEFSGHGTDTDGTVEVHEWSSDLDGLLSTDEDFSMEASVLSIGAHIISYRVQDDDGAWSTPDTEGLTVELGNDRFVNVQTGDNSNIGSYDAPFKTITHALTVVEASETAPARIHVAAGTYSASTNAEVFPLNMRSWVSLRGEDPEATVLDAEDAAYHVIYCDAVSNLAIEGFTITGGHADGSGLEHYGGGVLCRQSSPSILNNLINGNDAGGGGAIYCHDGSPAVISGNTITNNSASLGGGISGFNSSPTITSNTVSDNIGSGIYCDAETTVTDNTISGNEATGFRGGAIHCTGERSPSGMPMIQGNDIYDNSASYGGGIYCSEGSPTVKDNVITSNSSTYAFDGHGGGIHITEADALVSNNIIVGNSSAVTAGGIYCGDCAPTLCFNTIVSNQAAEGGDGISCEDSSPIINDCIIWDNGDDLYDCSATFCCIEDMDGGSGNIHSNPIFVIGPHGNRYLDPLSLCVNAGSTLATAAGLSDRTTQADGTPDTGVVDMGYHYPIPAKR